MVRPGGGGGPGLAISARPGRWPPRRLRMGAGPSALALPKRETHLLLAEAAFEAAARWRAAALRPDAGRVDFLFDRVRRVAVTMEPRTRMRPAPNDHRRGHRRKGADGREGGGGSADEMIDAVQSDESDDDEVDGDDVVQQSRHDQDQNAGDEGNQRRNMGNGDGHEDLLGSGR